jgi:hypothetical protein
MPAPPADVVLRAEGITKVFSGTVALKSKVLPFVKTENREI